MRTKAYKKQLSKTPRKKKLKVHKKCPRQFFHCQA